MPLSHTSRLPTGTKFSPKRAARVQRFIERATVHTKSVWSGKPFVLSSWQAGTAWTEDDGWHCDGIIAPLFGAVRWHDMYQRWVRRFTLAWLEVARKQGKSELAAAIALYMLIADGEQSAEIYGAAADRDQARMVFDVARDMIALSPVLKRMKDRREIEVIDSRKTIVHVPTRSRYMVIAADAAGNLGANPHAIVFDEVLAQPDERLWDYMRQGMGTRPQPLLFGITTAGPDRESFAYSEHEFGLRVAQEPDLDPKRLVYIASAEEGADWLDESKWADANPALGDFLDIEQLRTEAIEIKNKGDLSQIANFKIFRLNQWGVSKGRWLDVTVWDESEAQSGSFTADDIRDLWAVGGLDLAETTDFVSWQLVFPTPDRLYVLSRFWVTRGAIARKHRRMMSLLARWEEDSLITVVDRDGYDYEEITNVILNDIETFKVRAIGFDQFQAPAVIGKIEDTTDVICVKVPQSTTRMNPGSQELTRRLGLRQITTNANPVMRWMVDNVAYKQDSDRNIKPDKAASSDSIDGITALVNALVVDVTVPQTPEPGLFAFEGCPRCGEIDIYTSGGVSRCGECGHTWIEGDQ